MIRRFWMPACAGMTAFSATLIASPPKNQIYPQPHATRFSINSSNPQVRRP